MKRELKGNKVMPIHYHKISNRKAHPDEKGTERIDQWVLLSDGDESQGPSR